MTLLAVTGASGKTGWRVVQEALHRGYQVRAIVRPQSTIPAGLEGAEICRLDLGTAEALHAALAGCDGLVIATGARPSIDLFGPLKAAKASAGQASARLQPASRSGISTVLAGLRILAVSAMK